MHTIIKKTDPSLRIGGLNLLNFRLIRSMLSWKAFPYIFQLFMLIVFFAFITIGWQVYPTSGLDEKLFAKTNIVTLSIWGIWWPLMIWLAVTMGRVWCVICPLELVSNIFERLGRRLGVNQKSLQKWISGGAIIVFLYAFIQLLIAGFHLHRIPAYTSFFLIGLLTISAFVGLLYKDRAFCRGFCPIGMLLNAYGRGGMVAVRSGGSEACGECTGKDCISNCNKNNTDARSCPSLLNPPKLDSNKDCLVCGQCIKSCKPDNMQLLLRLPFDRNDAREVKASWPLTIFIILVSGFVTYELSTEWSYAKEIFLLIPNSFTKTLGANSWSGIIKGIWTIGVFPLIMWFLLGLSSKILNWKANIFDIWRSLALPMVIIISAGHLIKALAKLNSWLGYLPNSLNEVFIKNASIVNVSEIQQQGQFFDSSIISLAGLIILLISLIISFREEKIIYNRIFNYHSIPKLLLFVFFLFMVIGISF